MTRRAFHVLCVGRRLACTMALLVACHPAAEGPAPAVGVTPLHDQAVALTVDGRPVAGIAVGHVNTDPVAVDWHAATDRGVAVVQHGSDGSATLLVDDRGAQRVLWRTAADLLDTPRWSADGRWVAVARRRPPRHCAGGALQLGGELWLVDVARGARQRTAAQDVARVLGWDDSGRVLYTRHPCGDLPGETLARLDPGSDDEQPLIDVIACPACYGFALLGDRVAYARVARPVATLPGPDQRAELVVADLDGRTLLRAALPAGTLPVDMQRSGAELRFRLEGSGARQALHLEEGLLRALPAAGPPPPPVPPPSSVAWSTLGLPVPYVHQVYDTPNEFNGDWACGPTSTLMAVAAFGRLNPWPDVVDKEEQPQHTSDFGAYVSREYTYAGNATTTFDRAQNDASGKPAKGAYGWCTQGGLAYGAKMQDYAQRHDLDADAPDTSTEGKIQAALAAGKVVVLSTGLTSAGHIITVIGTTADGKLITNDPYGDRHQPGYPNPHGAGATYSWSEVGFKWFITVHGTPRALPPARAASVVDVSYPRTMQAGSTAEASITLRNEGSAAWTDRTRLGTTEPRDRASAFFTAGSWPKADRAAAAPATAPGETATFSFTLTAPEGCETQRFTEHFGLVEEAVGWFGDEGGPADSAIALEITVEPGAACTDVEPGSQPPMTEVPDPPQTAFEDPGGGDRLLGGCSVAGTPTGPGVALLAVLALRGRRVRRRRRVASRCV